MAERMNRDELDLLLGACALDALDDDEVAEVDAFLAEDPAAAEEVAAFKEMVGWLVEPSAQPSELWSGIHAALDPPPAETSRRSIARPVGRVLAIAAALVALIAVGVATISSEDGTDVVALAADAREHGAKTAQLRSADGSQRVEVVYAEDGQGYVLADELHRLPTGQTYQLWAMVGDAAAPRPISAGVLGRSVDAAIFQFDGPVVGFAITIEDAPGATAPAPTRLQGRLA
jgi:anti-sigma factor RsiW